MKNWICLTNSFLSNQLKGSNINKNYFSIQRELHTPKLYFSVFLSILGEILWQLLFLVKKVAISERSTEILRKFVFEKDKSEQNFDLFKLLFLIKPVKGD